MVYVDIRQGHGGREEYIQCAFRKNGLKEKTKEMGLGD